MLVLRRKSIPHATKENIVTDLTTEGESPAKIAKVHSKMMVINSRSKLAFLVLGSGLRIKLIKTKIKPTCKPDTDRICTAPASW